LGGTAEGAINFEKMQPQHLAFLAAYGMGNCSTEAAGTGYLHTLTPINTSLDARRDLPTFTGVQQLGGSIFKRLFASLAVDSFTLSFASDDWVKARGQLKGTGKTQLNIVSEQISGMGNAASIALAANGVEGSTAAARLDSIHQVRFKATAGGGWVDVFATAVSAATPAEITINPPTAGADAGTFEVLYVPTESASLDSGSATADPTFDYANQLSTLTDTAATMVEGEHVGRYVVMTSGTAESGLFWPISANTATTITAEGDLYSAGVRSADTYKIVQYGWLPINQAAVSEPPMRCDQLDLVVGGDYNGTSFSGGRALGDEVDSFEWSYNNAVDAKRTAKTKDAAGVLERGERTQTIRVDRRLADAIYQAMMENKDSIEAEYMAIRVSGEGPEYETGQTYWWEIIFPRVALGNAAPSVDGQKLKEGLELEVKAHPVHGSVIVKIRNKVAGYAA
jgi:hypothetical protein